ncbi:hypothetical protein CHUAL_012018 [Chamberlinius hualienensis]
MATTDGQYDLSAKEKELVLKRAALKESLKAEFLKKLTNPQRYGPHEAGYLFDPAIQRFMSMKATRYTYFQPTIKGFFIYAGMVLVPIIGLTYYFNKTRNDFDARCRRGEIPYRDRTTKFMT